MRNAAGVDDAVDADPVLGHALQYDARVEGRALDGGKELVLSGMDEIPAERDAAKLGIDQYGSIAVVPAEAQEAGLAGACRLQPFGKRGDGDVGAARDGSKMSPTAERPASMPVRRDARCRARRRRRREQVRLLRHGDDAGGGADDVDDVALADVGAEASQWASNAPTGMGIPARRPSSAAHFGEDGRRCGRW